MTNWLVKLCEKPTTKEAQFKQQLRELSPEDLSEIAANPQTRNLDGFAQRVSEAAEMGRELAHEHGTVPAQRAEEEVEKLAELISQLSDDEALLLADALDNGDLTKEAVIGAIGRGIAGMAGKALRSGAAQKAVSSTAQFAKKNPSLALAGGGALAGGALTGDLRGAIAGGAMAGGAGKLMGVQGKNLAKGLQGAYGRSLKSTAPFMKMAKASIFKALAKKTPPPIPGKGRSFLPGVHSEAMRPAKGLRKSADDIEYRAIASPGRLKLAFHRGDHGWLEQFEGSPLLQQALDLEQQLLEAEAEDLRRRQEERSREPSNEELWNIRDRLSMEKKLLELQLIAHRNGISEPDGDELGGEATTADHPEPDGDETAVADAPHGEMPMGGSGMEQQLKQAAIRAAIKNVGSRAGEMAKKYRTTLRAEKTKTAEPEELKIPLGGHRNSYTAAGTLLGGIPASIAAQIPKNPLAALAIGAGGIAGGALIGRAIGKKKDQQLAKKLRGLGIDPTMFHIKEASRPQ